MRFKGERKLKRAGVDFRIETPDRLICTSNDTSVDLVIVTRSGSEADALFNEERLRYYDLPAQWHTQVYWTRYDNSMETGNRFDDVVKNDKQLKPFVDKTICTR